MDTRKNRWIPGKDGRMMKNPNFQATPPAAPPSSQALATVFNMEEAEGLQLAPNTNEAISKIQSQEYLDKFHVQGLQGHVELEETTNVLSEFEIPIGQLEKLDITSEKSINIVIDDSPSMTSQSGVRFADASIYIKDKYGHLPQYDLRRYPDARLSRWHEAENRVYTFSQILKCYPIIDVYISFLNRKDQIHIPRVGVAKEVFEDNFVNHINQIFKAGVCKDGSTPLYGKLKAEFEMQRSAPTLHLVITDGEPNDCTIQQITDLIVFRGERPTGSFDQIFNETMRRASAGPVNLLSVSPNSLTDAAWMKVVDAVALFCGECAVYNAEKQEVEAVQGVVFPYTRGLDTVRQIVGAADKELDSLDEGTLTKFSLDRMFGRIHTDEEYYLYFKNSPASVKVQHLYDQFLRAQCAASEIIGTKSNQQILHEYLQENPNVMRPQRYANWNPNTNPWAVSQTGQTGMMGYQSTQPHTAQTYPSYPQANTYQAPNPHAPVSNPSYMGGNNPPPVNPQWSQQNNPPQQTMWNNPNTQGQQNFAQQPAMNPQGFHSNQPMPQQNWNAQQPRPQQGYTAQQPMPQQGWNSQQPMPQQGWNGQQAMPQQGFNSSQQPMPQQGWNSQQPMPQQGWNGQQAMPQQGFNSSQQPMPQQNFGTAKPSNNGLFSTAKKLVAQGVQQALAPNQSHQGYQTSNQYPPPPGKRY